MEDKKQLSVEERLDLLEKSLTEKDNTIKELQTKNAELTTKLNNFRIDGLTKQVDPTPVKVEEDIEFDFDMQCIYTI